MEREDALLMIAFRYLSGLVQMGTVKIEDLEYFVEQQIIPPDQQGPHLEPQLWVIESIDYFSKAVATQCVARGMSRAEFDFRMPALMHKFACLTALGTLTPLTMAILCNCGVSNFEQMLEEAERD